MLSDFFRINLPYGIAKNEKDEWMAFNREYLPLGFNTTESKGLPGNDYLDLPIYTRYKAVSEKLLSELADSEDSIDRNESGEIIRIFLYKDATNPMNFTPQKQELWDRYFKKVARLSKLSVKTTI